MQLGRPPRTFQAVPERRLCSFLGEWRRDYDTSPARERQAKGVSVEDLNKEAAKLAQKGFISRAVNPIKSFGIAPCTMKVT